MKQFIQRHIVLLGIVFIGALAGLGFVACTLDDDVLNRLDEKVTADSNPRLRTEAEAIEIAIGNLGMIDRAVPRSRAASDIVADVSVIGSKVKSRNGATNDTLLYAVNFKNNEGFALVPASRKADPLLAICEKGNYSPDCEKLNPGFGIYMGLAEKKLADLEKISDDQNSNTGNDGYEIDFNLNPIETDPNRIAQEMKETEDTIWHCRVMPRVKVQWNQRGIYGALATNKTAGCAPVAIAQAMSYFNYPKHMKFTFKGRQLSELNINWEEIKHHQMDNSFSCLINCDENNHTNISHILRQIGADAGSTYKSSKKTSTTNSGTKAALEKYGFSVSGFHNYIATDGTKIGYGIILICGHGTDEDGDRTGHIWVLDGVKNFTVKHTCYTRRGNNGPWEIMSQGNYDYHFNHFNWGWGGYGDGWFNDGVFNYAVPVDVSYSDQDDMGTPGYDYDDKVKYIIVNR